MDDIPPKLTALSPKEMRNAINALRDFIAASRIRSVRTGNIPKQKITSSTSTTDTSPRLPTASLIPSPGGMVLALDLSPGALPDPPDATNTYVLGVVAGKPVWIATTTC